MMTERKKRKTRSDKTQRYGKTVIPKGFKLLVVLLEKITEVNHKETVSVFSDHLGPLVSITRQGSSNKLLSLVLNKSRGWKPQTSTEGIEVAKWHTGDVRVLIPNNTDAMKRAAALCQEWMFAKRTHVPDRTVKGKEKK